MMCILNTLIIDDSPEDALLLTHALKGASDQTGMHRQRAGAGSGRCSLGHYFVRL